MYFLQKQNKQTNKKQEKAKKQKTNMWIPITALCIWQ